ncbi:MAG TPA: Uma2 family endonuclease [Pyrinomonadaceae bacterium]|jgi:Uma2 family endonuclease
MSAELKQKKKLTPEEYLELEEKAEYKSEYWDGVMVPLHGDPPELVGASENHNLIALNIAVQFRLKLNERCRTYVNDMKVWVESWKRFFYPDVVIVCGERKFYNNKRTAIENPILLVEVLLNSTEAKDRGEKFRAYRTLNMFQEYLLVSQDKAVIEQFVKQDDGSWKLWATIGLESTITLFSVGIELKFSDIYESVEFEAED